MNSRRAAPLPQTRRRRVAPPGRLVHLANQGGDDVRIVQAEIVARTEGVGRNPHDEVIAVLLPISLAELDAGEFGQGIGLVGRLQGPGHQVGYAHRLAAKLADSCRNCPGRAASARRADGRRRSTCVADSRLSSINSAGNLMLAPMPPEWPAGEKTRIPAERWK